MNFQIGWFVFFVSLDLKGALFARTDCPKTCVDDKKLDSTLKKMKKEVKKDFRYKILPKMFKSVEDDITDNLMVAVNREMQKTGTMIIEMEKRLASMNQKVTLLENENKLLKRNLVLMREEENAFCGNIVERLNETCSCDVNVTISRIPFAEEAKDVQAPSNVAVFEEMVNTSSNAGQATRGQSKSDQSHSWEAGNITFNISPDMPKFDHVSSMIIAEKGHLIRVALDNADRRGRIEVDKFVESVDYDPVSKRLFWTMTNSDGKCVYSAHLDGSNKTLLLEGRWIFYLAVESKKGMIFMSDWTAKQITAMTLNGEHYHIVRGDLNLSPKALVLDENSERLYVSFTSEIYRMKYDGTEYVSIAQGRWMKPMALDIRSNILFFSDERNLFGLDIGTSRKRLFNQLKSQINSMVFLDNKLYIAYQRGNYPIDVLNLSHNTVTQFTYIKGEWFRLCIIP